MLRRTLICLIFAVVCSFAESGTPVNSSQSCLKTIDCLTPRRNFKPKGKTLSDFDLANESILTSFCQLIVTQTRCVETTKSNCEQGEAIYKRTAVGRFVCSDSGKQHIRTMKKSQCVHDKKRAQEASKSINVCHQTYYRYYTELQITVLGMIMPRDMKTALDKWRICCTDEAIKWCGPEYGQFIKSLVSSDEVRFQDIVIISLFKKRAGKE